MSNKLAIIAGLGNPEERYARTLHNAGFWVADEIARRAGAEFRYEKRFDAEVAKATIFGSDIWIVKPMSYMNLSGGPIRAVLDYYRLTPASLLVAHDEIDLEPGIVRLKLGGGHGGHNGLRDIIRHCGADFMRLRIGVGHPGDKDKVTGYVLGTPSKDVEAVLQRGVDEAADIIPILLDRGLNEATKDLHTRTYPQ
ncbi:MAG: aminoacyl-tRNA hydrolase [Gammaproteobacteria bacterium]|nr:aminoacyl-tRNA hydrolase [Gammaproteobacteria bacterium]MDH4256267.1 aminoacyl-tRNA hydrolase [Gammaproteobacteria bacterium]